MELGRTISLEAPKPPKELRVSGRMVKTVNIDVVTPMFGGGVLAGTADPVTLVRVPSIRGQLRFWWRMLFTTQGETYSTFFARESAIWGSTDDPSKVSLTVSSPPWPQRRNPQNHYGFSRFGPEAYALFSAKQNDMDIVKEGLRFVLSLDFPADLEPQILTTLRAWLAFGGIGSRTRRGCGSLSSEDAVLAPSRNSLVELARSMKASLYLGDPGNDALQAWAAAVNVYRNFRQNFRGPRHPKNLPGKSVQVPGRSFWPEPDSIRQITGCALCEPGGGGVPPEVDTHDHTVPVVPATALPSFPRAVLGLPINFHFADAPPGKNPPPQTQRDPVDCQLLPDGDRSRMASPVITRAVRVNNQWRPLVLILPSASQAIGVSCVLEGKVKNGLFKREFSNARIRGKFLQNLRPMQGQEDALAALRIVLKNKGFVEVVS